MDKTLKIQYFDFFITELSNTTQAIKESSKFNFSFGKLKLMKLLFFISTINIDNWYLLENIFDKFYAMPYGPVESDIYDEINNLPNYIVQNNQTFLKKEAILDYSNLDDNVKTIIKQSIQDLKKQNENIFKLDSFKLVELTHKSDAWRIPFHEAQKKGSLSKRMSNTAIKHTKIFYK